MPNPDGSNDVIEIECLRSLDWIEENHIQEEGTTYFVLPEMGLEGRAIVETHRTLPRYRKRSRSSNSFNYYTYEWICVRNTLKGYR
jgi:hypothetical protein